MAIDTKTTAGGVIILFLSGTGGYLATNASNGEITTSADSIQERRTNPDGEQTSTISERSNSSESDSSIVQSSSEDNVEEGEQRSQTIDQTQAGSGDENGVTDHSQVITEISEETDTQTQETDYPKAMKEKIVSNGFGEVSSTEENCQTTLNKPITDDNYKIAVKSCFKEKTLKDRASELKIALLDRTTNDNFNIWKQRFDSFKVGEAHQIAKDSAASMNWITKDTEDNTNVTNMKAFCVATETLSLKKIVENESKQAFEKEWSSFLKMCAQTENLTKDFWIVETTKN